MAVPTAGSIGITAVGTSIPAQRPNLRKAGGSSPMTPRSCPASGNAGKPLCQRTAMRDGIPAERTRSVLLLTRMVPHRDEEAHRPLVRHQHCRLRRPACCCLADARPSGAAVGVRTIARPVASGIRALLVRGGRQDAEPVSNAYTTTYCFEGSGDKRAGADERDARPEVRAARDVRRSHPAKRISPMIATWIPSMCPSFSRIVNVSSNACVGCSCAPSPALITLASSRSARSARHRRNCDGGR